MAKLGWHGSRRRKGGKYQARWCDSEGLRSEGGFISKTQADAYALRMANEALNVKVGLAVYRKPILEAREQFLQRRTKENTRALNTRRIDEFLALMPEVKDTNHLTRDLINRFALALENDGHNPGGVEHHLRIVRAFCKFCFDQKWMAEYPFKGFVMPKSEFQGRPVTPEEAFKIIEPESGQRIVAFKEYDKRRGIFRVRYNDQNGHAVEVASGIKDEAEALAIMGREQVRLDRLGVMRPIQVREGDLWLKEAFIFGRSTMLRISQVWKLMPSDFVVPDQLRVAPIKGQEPVWIPLRQDAIDVLNRLKARLGDNDRFFWYWSTVESMRTAVEGRVRRAGIAPTIYMVRGEKSERFPRFHDICKVTRISELEKDGYSLGELAHLSNTSKKTLIDHYIKADRSRAFERYKNYSADRGHTVATIGPKNEGFVGVNGGQGLLDGTIENIEIASTSRQIPA